MSNREVRGWMRKLVGGIAALAIVATGLIGGAVASAASPEHGGEVAAATLSWGVKTSFRSYLLGNIAHGQAELIGSNIASPDGRTLVTYLDASHGDRPAANWKSESFALEWSAGTGTAATDGSLADVSFDGGLHLTGHPMTDGNALDLQFLNPRIEVASATSATLYLDIRSREFAGFTGVSDNVIAEDNVAFASLSLPAPSVSGDLYTWTNASAALTEDGAQAFGGFYGAGEVLDPVSFSLPITAAQTPEPTVAPTPTPTPSPTPSPTTTLVETRLALETDVAAPRFGESVTLTATLTPAQAAGTITFTVDGVAAAPTTLTAGKATLVRNDLAVGEHRVKAKFTPKDPTAFSGSLSTELVIRVAPKVSTTLTVEGAKLSWGIKSSFRSYVTGPIAHGHIELKGSLAGQQTARPFPEGFAWTFSGGSGTVASDARQADVAFTDNSSVRFIGHEMVINGQKAHALDLRFSNPRVVIRSADKASLLVDVASREFAGMTSLSETYFEQAGVAIADLALGEPSYDAAANTFSWHDAAATLTQTGARAFGGFYEPGTELDPVSFTLPFTQTDDIVIVDREQTTLKLVASATEITYGQSVTLTATVAPIVPGTVVFSTGGRDVSSVEVGAAGKASVVLRDLSASVNDIRATFKPDDDEHYAHSFSNTVTVAVHEPAVPGQPGPSVPGQPGGGTPGGSTPGSGTPAQTAPGTTPGWLQWSISNYFAGYTSQKSNSAGCPTPSRHCAGGSISTSGVGSGWLFPQSSSSWDAASQTGSIDFTGSVTFNGYGSVMFQVVNPRIVVHNASRATLYTGYSGNYGPSSVPLDLSAAGRSVDANGAVTFSGVPVQGGLVGISASQSVGFDSLSFTVGATSQASFGSAVVGAAVEEEQKPEYVAAEEPPAKAGITVLTKPDRIVEGGRIAIEASGFTPGDSGILVVLYSEPVVLDQEATADEQGIVRWTGTLPEGISGKHTITLQGSAIVGAEIDIKPKTPEVTPTPTPTPSATSQGQINEQADEAPLEAAAIVPVNESAGGNNAGLWLAAGGLTVVAGITSVLAIRKKRAA